MQAMFSKRDRYTTDIIIQWFQLAAPGDGEVIVVYLALAFAGLALAPKD